MGSRRTLIRIVFLGVVPVAVLALGAERWAASTRYVTTDNAYVKTNLIHISAEISGRVDRVFVAENGLVAAGAPVFGIDPAQFRIALDRAQARLATVMNDIAARRAAHREARMELDEAREDIAHLERIHRRRESLLGSGHVSRAAYEEAERNLRAARARARVLRQRSLKLLAGLGGEADLASERHPEYLAALAARHDAEIDLGRTVVRAPREGRIGRLRLQAGEYVRAGDAVVPLIETGRSWIEANLKETQLTHLRVGQRAEVVIDAFPSRTWRARVASISPSTGAELSVLPPQNATGNWVKIVQRVPVRLEIEAAPDRHFAMPSGVTAAVRIDTGREVSLLDLANDAFAFASDGG